MIMDRFIYTAWCDDFYKKKTHKDGISNNSFCTF